MSRIFLRFFAAQPSVDDKFGRERIAASVRRAGCGGLCRSGFGRHPSSVTVVGGGGKRVRDRTGALEGAALSAPKYLDTTARVPACVLFFDRALET
jgi:hypothetical protein